MNNSHPPMLWQALGDGFEFDVVELAISPNNTLYALWQDSQSTKTGIAKWEGAKWVSIGTWENTSVLSPGKVLCADKQENVFVLLRDHKTWEIPLRQWNGAAWAPVGTTAPSQLAMGRQGQLYGIGNFNKPQHPAVHKYSNGVWTPIQSPPEHSCAPLQMVVDSNNTIYATFQTIYPKAEPFVYLYKRAEGGTEWTLLGSINTVDCRLAIDESDSVLYFAGDFTTITPPTGPEVSANGLAKWNKFGWQALDAGGAGKVLTMACGNSRLYVGRGWRDEAEEWNGDFWTRLYLRGAESIVADGNGNVYAGGSFSIYDKSGNYVGRNVAKYFPDGVPDSSISTQKAKLLTEQNAPSLGLGFAVSISKDKNTIATLAPSGGRGYNPQGSLYVFSRSPGSDAWTQTKTLLGVMTSFCPAVELGEDSNTIFVGAMGLSSPGCNACGAVLIYGRDQNQTLSIKQTLENPEPDANPKNKSLFGQSLAVSGSTMVVGASNYFLGVGTKLGQSGYAYVFAYDANSKTWGAPVKLTSPNAAVNDRFGQSVAISDDGNTIVVGAPGKNQAYLFTRDTNGAWSPGTALGGATETNEFGDMVAISANGNRITVSARTKDQTFIFSQIGGQWARAELPSAKTIKGDHIGHVVAMNRDGSRVVVGDPYDTTHPELNSDAAYIFEFNSTTNTWEQVRMLAGNDTTSGDQFGMAVAISDDGKMIVVGAPGVKVNNANVGAMYIFE